MCYCFPMMSSVKQLRIVALNSLQNVIVCATIKNPIQSGFETIASAVWSVWQVLSDPCQHQKVILAQCCMYAHTNKRDLQRLCIGRSPFICLFWADYRAEYRYSVFLKIILSGKWFHKAKCLLTDWCIKTNKTIANAWISFISKMQWHIAVAACPSSKELLLFAFEEEDIRMTSDIIWGVIWWENQTLISDSTGVAFKIPFSWECSH